MAQSLNIKTEPRTALGSRAARALRSAGRIPANLQADGTKPHLDFHIDQAEFMASRRHHIHLYDLDFGKGIESAVVRELQWDPFGEALLHVEFRRVQRDVETTSHVALEFVGTPKKGLLNHLLTEIAILSLPHLIPDSIEVRVSELVEGQHIRASDLILPQGVKLGIPPETEIAIISGQRDVDLEARPLEATEVEIIGEKKREGEEAG